MICDEVKPNCIVRTCCTKRCWEVNNVIKDNLKMVKSAHDYAYGNMRKNNYCPVCHSNIFSYKYINKYSLTLYINCRYCHAHYELMRYDNDWRLSKTHIATQYHLHHHLNDKDRSLKEIFKYMKNK